jgi:multidrug efflux pump subunit AcrA (membrane-fusion protein)
MILPKTHLGCLALLLLIGCDSDQQAGPDVSPQDSQTQADAAPSNIVEIPTSVQRNLGITFAPVQLRRVAQTLRIPGAFELQPLARKEYRMSIAGRVEIQVDENQTIQKGQVLYRFQSTYWPELMHEIIEGEQDMQSAAADLIVVKARIAEARLKLDVLEQRITNLAKAEFKRADLELTAAELQASFPRLEAEQSASEAAVLNAERSYEHALHRAATATRLSEETLLAPVQKASGEHPYYETIEWIDVRADAAGVVERLFVTNGAYVDAPNAVLSTVMPDRVRFRALALQSDLQKLVGVNIARIVPPQSSATDIANDVGSDLTLGLEAMPRERFITVFAKPEEGRDWIRPGFAAFLEIELDASADQVMAIPRSAVLQDGLVHVFFRRNPKNPSQAYRVEADLGVDDGRWVEIKSGLMRGDQVVMQGVFELKLASERSGGTPKGGHFHSDGTFHEEEH